MNLIRSFISLVLAAGLIWSAVIFVPKLSEHAENTQATSVRLPDNADSVVASLLSESLEDASGDPNPLAQWKGQTLLINFWASWCAPCLEEMPRFSALASGTNAKNLQILGIALDRKENVAEYARVHQPAYPLLIANDKVRALLPGLGNAAQGIPFSLLINAQGHVLDTRLGVLKAGDLQAWLVSAKKHSSPNGTQKL